MTVQAQNRGILEGFTAGINVIDERTAAKEESDVIESLTERLITAAGNTNRYGAEKQLYRNRVNYENAKHSAQLLNLFGAAARIECFVIDWLVCIPRVVINGKATEFYTSNLQGRE